MSERDNLNDELAQALRALPDAAPPADLWPQLAHTLAQRRRRRVWRRALPAALAASLLAAMLAPRLLTHDTSPPAPTGLAGSIPATPPDTAGTAADLAALRDRSHTLERWIAAVSAQAPQDSRDLMAAVEIEDRIGLLDLQIDASRDPRETAALWQRRVDLLETLATVRAGAALAASGDAPAPFSQLL